MSNDIKKKILLKSRIYDDEEHFPYTTLSIKDIVSEIATSEEDFDNLLTIWDIIECSIVQSIKDRKSIQLPYFGTFMPRKIKGYKRKKSTYRYSTDKIGYNILNNRHVNKIINDDFVQKLAKRKVLIANSLKSREIRKDSHKKYKSDISIDVEKAKDSFKKLNRIKKELVIPNTVPNKARSNFRLDKSKSSSVARNLRNSVRYYKNNIIHTLYYMGISKEVINTIPFAHRVGTKDCLDKYRELQKITTAAKQEYNKTKDISIKHYIVEFLQNETK